MALLGKPKVEIQFDREELEVLVMRLETAVDKLAQETEKAQAAAKELSKAAEKAHRSKGRW